MGSFRRFHRYHATFSFLAIKLNCSDRFSSKTNIPKVVFACQIYKVLKKIHGSKETRENPLLNFAFSGYADVIIYQEKPMFSFERGQITEVSIISARAIIKL